LKQYGEKRTGTNYLRALLFANYRNVLPLMHVLGDKHSPPVDFPAHWEKARSQPEAIFNFVTSTTWAAPAETTCAQDSKQLRHLREVATALTDAFCPGRLGFVITVKHPYSWAASLARYNSWLNPPDGVMGREHAESLRLACDQYNRRHEAWLELHRRSEERCLIIRYEKLLEEPVAALSLLERKFGLLRSGPEPVVIRDRTLPTHWDDHPVSYESVRFDPSPYRDRTYQDLLTPELWTVVRETIDWDLAARFGYHELHFRRSSS
jgi:hypothetical protein